MLLYIVFISEILSLYLLYRIWSVKDHLALKVLLSIVTLIPIVGPIFFVVGTDRPAPTATVFNDKKLLGRGRYTQWWADEKPRMQKKIKELEEKLHENNNDQK